MQSWRNKEKDREIKIGQEIVHWCALPKEKRTQVLRKQTNDKEKFG